MFDIFRLMLLLPAVALVLGCSEPETAATSGVPRVYTTFYPTTYFAERIGGGRVDVVCPLPEGEDPIFWMPGPETIHDYQQADLIVVNGAHFERWVDKVSLPQSKVVDTTGPLAAGLLKYESAVTHSHGTGGQHSHEGVDGHTWLDPENARRQAAEIEKALSLLVPEAADEFQTNFAALAADLDELARSLDELSAELGGRHLLASHPAYNYLGRRYEWDLASLDLDPAQMPDEETLASIRARLDSKPATVILWESPPAEEIAQRLREELGLASVVFSPCESLDETSAAAGQDYLTVMKANVAALKAAITP